MWSCGRVRASTTPGRIDSRPPPRRPGATADVLTYARNLAAGDVIQPEDVVWTQVQAHQANASGPQDAEQVIGLSARRALRAGSPVAARDLASPQVIARNDTVEVAFVSGGVKLTVTGRATRNAAIGEPVPVLNLAVGQDDRGRGHRPWPCRHRARRHRSPVQVPTSSPA